MDVTAAQAPKSTWKCCSVVKLGTIVWVPHTMLSVIVLESWYAPPATVVLIVNVIVYGVLGACTKSTTVVPAWKASMVEHAGVLLGLAWPAGVMGHAALKAVDVTAQ